MGLACQVFGWRRVGAPWDRRRDVATPSTARDDAQASAATAEMVRVGPGDGRRDRPRPS